MLEIFYLKNKIQEHIKLPYGLEYFIYEINEQIFCYVKDQMKLYLLNLNQNEHLILIDKFENLISIQALLDEHFYLYSVKIQFYCKWSKKDLEVQIDFIKNCQPLQKQFQTTSPSIKELFIYHQKRSQLSFFSQEKILISFNKYFNVLYVLDILDDWSQIDIIFYKIYDIIGFFFSDQKLYVIKLQGEITQSNLISFAKQQNNKLEHSILKDQNESKSLWNFEGLKFHSLTLKIPYITVINENEVLNIRPQNQLSVNDNSNNNQNQKISDFFKGFITNIFYEITNQLGYTNALENSKVIGSQQVYVDFFDKFSKIKIQYKFLLTIEKFALRIILLQGNNNFLQMIIHQGDFDGPMLANSYVKQCKVIIFWYKQTFQIFDIQEQYIKYVSIPSGEVLMKLKVFYDYQIELSSDQLTMGILMINKVDQVVQLYVIQIVKETDFTRFQTNFTTYLEYSYLSTGNNIISAIYQNKTIAFVFDLNTREYKNIRLESQLTEKQYTISLTASNNAIISYFNTTFSIRWFNETNPEKSFLLQQKATLQYFYLFKRSSNNSALVIFTDTEIVIYELQSLEQTQNITLSQDKQILPCPGKKELIEINNQNLQTNNVIESEKYLYVRSDGQLICIVSMKEQKPYPMKKIYSKIYVSGINILKRNETANQVNSYNKEDILVIKGMSATLLYERSNEEDDYKLYFESQISCRDVNFLGNNLICENTGSRETQVFPSSKSSLLNKIRMNSVNETKEVNYELHYYMYLPSKQLIIMKTSNKFFKATKLNTKEQIIFSEFTYSEESKYEFQEDEDQLFGFYYDELSNVFLQVSKNSFLNTYSIENNGTIGEKQLHSLQGTQMVYLGIIQKKQIILYWIPSNTSFFLYDYFEGKQLLEQKLEIDKTQVDKSLKLFDFNDNFLYILIARILYKFTFETSKSELLINFSVLTNDQLTWFSSIYCAQNNEGIFLINQLDIYILNSITLDIEIRRFQNQPEYFLPTFNRQLNLITLIPISSSKIYYLFFLNNNPKASDILVYETEFQYSIHTRYIDSTNQIMCVLTVDSVIHFIDLKPITDNTYKQTLTNSQNNSGNTNSNNQNINSDDQQNQQETIIYYEHLSFSLHDLLEDLVNSNGLDNAIRIQLQMIYNLDIFVIGYLRNLYVYQISKKQSLFIARSHLYPIFKVLVINDQILLTGDKSGVYLWSIEEMIKFKTLLTDLRSMQNIVFQSNYKENKDSFTFYNQDNSQLFIVDKENAKILKRKQIQKYGNDKTYYVNNSWQKINKKYTTLFQNNTASTQNKQNYLLLIYIGNLFLFFDINLNLKVQIEHQIQFKQLLGFSKNIMYYSTTQNSIFVSNLEQQRKPLYKLTANYQVVQSFQSLQQNNIPQKLDVSVMESIEQDEDEGSFSEADDELNEIFLILNDGSINVLNCKIDPFGMKNIHQIFAMNLKHETIQSIQITTQHIIILNSVSEVLLLRYIAQTPNSSSLLGIIKVFTLPQIQFSSIEFDIQKKRLFLLSSVDNSIYQLNYLPFISFDPQMKTVDDKDLKVSQLFQKTNMQLPSNKNNKFLISQDQQYYIVYSNFFLNIYYSQDFKLKVQINQVFYQSKIQQVRVLTDNILFVSTQSEVVLFIIHSSNLQYSVSHNICFNNAFLYHFTSQKMGKSSPNIYLQLQLYLNSHSGFTKLVLQIDLSQINKQQRLKNIFSAILPQKSCISADFYNMRQQIALSNLQDSSKSDQSKLQNVYTSQYKTYDCILQFDLIYSSMNQKYISTLFNSLEEINYKSLQQYQPRTVKIKVPKSKNPFAHDVAISSGSFLKSNYSQNLDESIILLNQNSTFGQMSGQSLFLYNIAFFFGSKTEQKIEDNNKTRILSNFQSLKLDNEIQILDQNQNEQYNQNSQFQNGLQIFEEMKYYFSDILQIQTRQIQNQFINQFQSDNLNLFGIFHNRQLQAPYEQLAEQLEQKIIRVENRIRFTLKRIRFMHGNNELTFRFQNITRQLTDTIYFVNNSLTFSIQSWDSNLTKNKTYYDYNTQLFYNNTQCFIQFSELQTLKASNIIFKNITCGQHRPFIFHFEKVKALTISNITIEDINTIHLKMFSFREIEKLIIQNITVRNVNLDTFNLFTFQNIQDLIIQNITILDLKQQITLNMNRNYIIQMFGVISSEISNFIIKNSTNSLFLFSSQLTLTMNEINIGNRNFKLDNLEIINSKYYSQKINSTFIEGFLASPFIKIECRILTFTNVKIYNYTLGHQLLQFKTENATFNKFRLKDINQKLSKFTKQILIESTLELSLINMDLIKNQNICISIQNTKKLIISNTNIIKNEIITDQNYSETSNLPLLVVQGAETVNINKLFLIENFSLNTSISFISLQDVNRFYITQSNFSSNYATTSSGGAMTIFNSNQKQFQNNIGISYIIQSIFFNNTSFINSGGALYLKDVNLDINETKFENNYAHIGGAIRVLSYYNLSLFYQKYLNKNSPIKFQNNTSLFYGDDIGFYPQQIQLTQTNEKNENNSLTISNFRSGDTIQDIQVKLLDYEGYPVNLLGDQITSEDIKMIFSSFLFTIFYKTDKINVPYFNIKKDKSLKNFILNLTAVSEPLTTQTLMVYRYGYGAIPLIKKVQGNAFELEFKQFDQSLNIQARSCLQGEVYQTTMGISTCLPCPEGKYSFLDPDTNDKQKVVCKICPPYAVSCMINKIYLKNGYWRESEQSEDVYECEENSQNCNAENPDSKYYCSEGFVGPLCSSCDIEGKVWSKRYSKISSVICKSCSFYGIQVFLLCGFLVISVLYLMFLMSQNKTCTIRKIQAQYLKLMGVIRFGKSAQFQRNSILSKMLMHYVQILLIIMNSSKFKIPNFFDVLQVSGDPIMNIYYSLDCFLAETDYQIVLLRIIWTLFYVFFLVGTGFFYFIYSYWRDKSKQKQLSNYVSFFSMSVKMVLMYVFPGLLTQLTKVLTCVQIGSQKYSLADLQYSCSDKKYQILAYYFVLPIFFILVVILPIILLYRIRRISIIQKPTKIRLQKSFGFLFYDYKINAYYWEIIKLQLKSLIIVSSTLLHSYVMNSLLITLVMLMIYIFFLLKVKPYKILDFNSLDFFAHLISSFTIVFILISLSTVFSVLKYACFCIIVIINSFFVLKILIVYFSGIIIAQKNTNRTYFQKIFFILKKLFPRLFSCIKLQKENSFKILLLWHKLSQHVSEKRDIFNQVTVSQLSKILNQDQSLNIKNKEYDEDDISQIKKLNNQDISQCESNQVSQFIYNKNRTIPNMFNQSHATSLIELSVQEHKELNKPKYQLSLKNQIQNLNNMQSNCHSQDSPTQFSQFKFNLQQNKNTDSDSETHNHECKMINLISTNTNTNSHAVEGKIQNTGIISSSMQSCSNFLSQKSLERISSKQLLSPTQQKKSYIQKAILMNRMKDKEFSVKSPLKRESLKTGQNLQIQTLRKAQTLKTAKQQFSQFSLNNLHFNFNQSDLNQNQSSNQSLNLIQLKYQNPSQIQTQASYQSLQQQQSTSQNQHSSQNQHQNESITMISEIISPITFNTAGNRLIFPNIVQNSATKNQNNKNQQKITSEQDTDQKILEKQQEQSHTFSNGSHQSSIKFENICQLQKSTFQIHDDPQKQQECEECANQSSETDSQQIADSQISQIEKQNNYDYLQISPSFKMLKEQQSNVNIPKNSEKVYSITQINQFQQDLNSK